ncbi:MAG TPA: hypothetical protein VEG32_15155 [Clostridia bacterium]|nr:hypothetical protein [Clostridia bacterium]
MRRQLRSIAALALSLLFSLPLLAATPGSFRGVLIDAPGGEKKDGYIFLQARNGNVRKVEVAKATVTYDAAVPEKQRHAKAQESLVPGAEVRITATQGNDGEWHASQVEIMGDHRELIEDDVEEQDDATITIDDARQVTRKI